MKNRDAGQLGCLGLNAIQKVAVGRHGVIFALQLAEQAVLCVQVIREQSIGLICVLLFIGIEHSGVVLPILSESIAAVSLFPIILPDFHKAFYLSVFVVKKGPFFFQGFIGKLGTYCVIG